jgi:hypothetical protein
MGNRDIRDVLAGLAMMGIGAFMGWYAYNQYDIGQLNRMGPGFFPVGLGALLAVVGFLIALPALFRPGSPIKLEGRTLLMVSISIIVFSFLLKSLGIIFATLAAVLISSLADRELSWKARFLVAIGVAVITWAVFILGLSMVLPVWPWSP